MSAPVDLARLRALAEKATKGPWAADRDDIREYLDGIRSGVTLYGAPGHGIVAYMVSEADEEANGDYIAAAHPGTVLALLDALAVAREALEIVHDHTKVSVQEFDKKWGPYESGNLNYDEPWEIAKRTLARIDALVKP